MARVLGNLPPRGAAPRDLEVRPKHAIAAFQALPLAQAFESSRQLAAHLVSLNHVRLDPDDRVQILEGARPVAAVLLEELDAVYSKSTLPHAQRARDAIALARQLCSALAVGYRVAVADKSSKLLAFGAKRHAPLLLHRAMGYLFGALRAAYKSYTHVPPGTWSELHELYLYAEQQGCAREVVDEETKSSIYDVYTEALLLALADPYRMAPGEVDKALAQARAHRGLATLGQARPPTPSGGHFLVPCDTDKPPKPALSANDDAGGGNWRLLDANALVDKLRARRHALETGNVSAAMRAAYGADGPALLARLVTLWGDPPRRAHRRLPAEGTVAICVGLRAVTHFLAFEASLDPAAQEKALREGITIPLMALPTDDASQTLPVFEWTIVNQSDGGLKVRRAALTPQPLAVGEVVGIKFPAKPRWTVGVLRWVTTFDDGAVEFGLQFMAESARGAWVQPAGATSPQARPGLLLDGDAPGDALLAPPGTFAELREYEVTCGADAFAVRATGLIEKTGRADLFHVAPLLA